MALLPTTRSCFVCGRQNPIGLRLVFETNGSVVQTRFVPQRDHVGFKETIHGGIISTVLDEAMVWACGVATKRFAYCAELTVRFHRPVRPGISVVATGELIQNRKNRVFEARAELRDEQRVLLAGATGKYLPLDPQETAVMLGDFDGSTEAVFPASISV